MGSARPICLIGRRCAGAWRRWSHCGRREPSWPTRDNLRLAGRRGGAESRRVAVRHDRSAGDLRAAGHHSMFFGIPEVVAPRVAVLEEVAAPAAPAIPPPDILTLPVVPPWRTPSSAWANQRVVQHACLPSSGAIMNARALARHYAALAGPALDSVSLLPPKRIQQASALQLEGRDRVLGVPVRRALGYHLGEPQSAMSARSTAFGHA